MLSYLSFQSLAYLASVFALYVFTKTVYRLYFHPLSSVPGPRLAAATTLYNAYYDLAQSGLVKHYPALHAKYGPVIRIQPNHVHVADLEWYNQIHRVGSRYDRIWHDQPFLSGSLQSKATIAETKKRREFISPFFSKAAISRAETQLHGRKLALFLKTLDEANGSVVNFFLAFRCLTADLVMDYCFRSDLNALASAKFENETLERFVKGFDMAILGAYFPNFFRVLNRIIFALPENIRETYFAPVYGFQTMQSLARERVKDAIKRADEDGSEKLEDETMFDAMARPDTSKGQVRPSKTDMVADGCLMIAAGSDTTANTLGLLLWHVTQNPEVEKRLLQELKGKMGLEETLTSAQLEGGGFEYLHAVVKESLRVSYGVPGSILRKVPREGVQIHGNYIAGGTIITSTIYMQNTDPNTFPDPFKFDPERWLCDHETYKEREKQMLTFSRGSRSCIGMNLALATLNLTTAHLFRRYEITTKGYTTEHDMEWKDRFVPVPYGRIRGMVNKRVD